MKKPIRTIIILILFFQFTIGYTTAQKAIKRAGVCFRIDDNHSVKEFQDYASVFDAYGSKFCYALNLGLVNPTDKAFISAVKTLIDHGHEMMDHTANHSTKYFTVRSLSDTLQYSMDPGIDHINQTKICLKIDSVHLNNYRDEGPVVLNGNRVISSLPGEFKNFNSPDLKAVQCIYLPAFNKLCAYYNLYNKNANDPDTIYLSTYWNETFKTLKDGSTTYKKLGMEDVFINRRGIYDLMLQTKKYCDEFNFPYPSSWIQPGDYHPRFKQEEITEACKLVGYNTGAVGPNPAMRYFNEYDPYHDRRFSFLGFDFNSEIQTFKTIKTVIADGIANHKVLLDIGHFGTYSPNTLLSGWKGYIQRMDSILSWCHEKNILVETAHYWVPLLYDSIPNPYQNVFPSLSTDLDKDGFPDGFNKNRFGEIYSSGGVQSSDGYYLKRTTPGFFCTISGLGGIEKGMNRLEFFTQCNPNDLLVIKILFEQSGKDTILGIKPNSKVWKKQAIEFNCPASITTISLMFYTSTLNPNLKLSGISLRKKSILIADSNSTSYLPANMKIKSVDIHKKVKEDFYSKDSLRYTIIKPVKLIASFDPLKNLVIHKPTPFWQGTDAIPVKVENPDNSRDTIELKYVIKEPVYYLNDTIDLQPDFIALPDNVTISSIPYDPTLALSSNYNYKANPKVNTTYIIEGKYKNGNIVKDSLHIKLNQRPVSTISLLGNNPICEGGSAQLIADNTSLKTEWYFNDKKIPVAETTHSISAKLAGKYSLIQTDQFGTSVKSNNIVIEEFPSISIKTQKKIITCATHPFFVQINCTNTDSIQWSVIGDGSITKLFNHNILYSPGSNDLKRGKSVLKYAAYGFNNCKIISDSIVVYFKNPILSQPVLKQGEILIPQNQFEYTRYIVAKKNADTINWTIEPRIAATLASKDSICDVYWNNKISGQVKLNAIATNKCGYMATSIFSVNLKNLTNSNSVIEEGIVDFSFSPNPVIHGSGLIKLNKYPTGTQKLKLFNQVGMLLLEKSINSFNNANSTFPLNLSSFPKGIYFIQIGNQTKKIMIL